MNQPPTRKAPIPMTDEDLENRFCYHPPKVDQAQRYERVRAGCLILAKQIRDLTPVSREQSTAITHLDAVMMFANAAIARNE